MLIFLKIHPALVKREFGTATEVLAGEKGRLLLELFVRRSPRGCEAVTLGTIIDMLITLKKTEEAASGRTVFHGQAEAQAASLEGEVLRTIFAATPDYQYPEGNMLTELPRPS